MPKEKKKGINELNTEGKDVSINKLAKRIRNLETEKQLLDAERLRLEQELHSLRNEIDRLREPPLIAAVIVQILDADTGRILVMSSTGPAFAVNASRKVMKDNPKIGQIVLLNQRTYAVMGVINITEENWERANKTIYHGVIGEFGELLKMNRDAITEQLKVTKAILELIQDHSKIMESALKRINSS